jgi:predicted alpha/beta-hydrolase family hydrolase
MMRSKGIGGATAAEMSAYYAKKRPTDKPPPGVKAELDAMKQEKANEAGMKAHEGRRLAKGGSVKGGGCEQRGLRKCKVV